MKKAVFIALLLALGAAFSSQAVVIGWAVESLPAEAAMARLIYVADGSQPSLDGSGNWSAGVELVSGYVSGSAIDGSTLYPQETTDAQTRSSGAYYVVLFNAAFTEYAVSSTAAAYNDAAAVSTGDFDPITGYFTPTTFTGFEPIPEPSTAMLLIAGVAVAVLRRSKRA